MAAFFPPSIPPTSDHTTRATVKMSGFAVPSSSTSTVPPTSSALASLHHSSTSVHSAIDPSVLFGLAGPSFGPNSNTGWNAFAAANHYAGTTGGVFGSSSVLTETDLDIENMLASFSQHHANHHAHASNATNTADPQHYYPASSVGPGSAPSAAAGTNGFLGSTSMSTLNLNGDRDPSQPSRFRTSESQAHPPSSAATIPPFAQSPSHTSPTIPAADFFPPTHLRSLGNSNKESPFADPGSSDNAFAAPASKRSPPGSSTTVSRGREGRSLSRASAGSSERTGSGSRSRAPTAGVGKAPRTSRSRSARRNSTAAGYQDRPSPSANTSDRSNSNSGTASTSVGNNQGGANPPSTTAAIIIPSANGEPLHPPSHQYPASMPAYNSSGTPSSLPSSLSATGSWFSQSGLSFIPPPLPLPPLGSVPEQASDEVTGWKPIQGLSMPASAPAASSSITTAAATHDKSRTNSNKQVKAEAVAAAGSNKSKKAAQPQQSLEDVQEEEGDDKPFGAGGDVSEKRRKRRESHNLVERRRRDNINDRIAELSELVPEHFIKTSSMPPPTAPGIPRRSSSSSTQGGGGSGGAVASGATVPDATGSPPAGLGVAALSLMSPGPPPPVPIGIFGTSPVSGGSGATMMANASGSNNGSAGGAAAAKANKGVILAKSVEYIRHLLETVELQTQQIAELQRQNQDLRTGQGPFTSMQYSLAQDRNSTPLDPRQGPNQQHHSQHVQNGDWAAFEDEDVGDEDHKLDLHYKSQLDQHEDDHDMDQT
ncbi:uncharacterized protein JCM15063_004419 [Sporobolomyces koalae]|uniref:uncharacterized protein n=1 Tax=Sporobolomyces koalae TaxID=500713 RepID=UPI00316CA689